MSAPLLPKQLVVNDDGHGGFYADAYTSAAALEDHMHQWTQTAITVFEWNVTCGSRVNYASEFSELMGEGVEEFPRRGDKIAHENMKRIIAEGADALTICCDVMHEAGKRCFAGIRANGDYGAGWMGPALPAMFNSNFWREHPQFRIINADGTENPKLSYAYPEVREWKLKLAAEVMQRPIDGICIDFLRHPPFVGYEPILTDCFKSEFGRDVAKVRDDDPLRLVHWARPMTTFMEGLRRIADEAAARNQRSIQISVRVDDTNYLTHGLDIQNWIQRGLIDTLIVSRYGLGGFEFDFSPFVEMAHVSGCEALISEENILDGHDTTPQEDKAAAEGKAEIPTRSEMPIAEYCRRALKWYEQGADGIHIFNNYTDPTHDAYSLLHDPTKCRQYMSR